MKSKKCLDCNAVIQTDLEYCNECLKYKWEYSSGFIKPKHNPLLLPNTYPKFRSVVTADFITNKSLFIHTIVESGSFFYDNEHNNYCCVLNQALGVVSGSAIPPYYSWPTYPLDSIIVVDAINNPHAFAKDFSVITSEIMNGKLIPAS